VDPERRNAVLLIGGISAVVAAALLLIGYGYYTDRVEPRRENVLRVGDRHFNYAFIERRILSDVAQGIFDPNDVQNSISQSIARVQREELIRIIARERGIGASSEEIDDEIGRSLGIGTDVDHNAVAAVLRREIVRVKLPLDDYLDTVEAEVLQDKIEAQFTEALPAQAEQVNLLMIQAGSQSNAILAKQALDAGRPFAEVAAQYSQDESKDDGGAFGWAPRELLDPQLADVAFNLTGRSDIIETEKDFYIIEVLGKETREITPQMKTDIGNNGFRDVLEQAFTNTAFAYNLTQAQLARIAGKIQAALTSA
jgi:parvulin-like peptidyl-prolyl isomerase